MSSSEDLMTRDKNEDKTSIYRTRVQFCVENENALRKTGVSGYLSWDEQSHQNIYDIRSIPKEPRPVPLKAIGTSTNSSPCRRTSARVSKISLPCLNTPLGNTGRCSHLVNVRSRETCFLWPFPSMGHSIAEQEENGLRN